MLRYGRTLVLSICAVYLVSCGPIVKQVDYAPSLIVPEEARPSPIFFSGVDFIIPVGATLGTERIGKGYCSLSSYPVGRDILRKMIDHQFIYDDMRDALRGSGYDVVDSLHIAFDQEDEIERAEYNIKAKIRDVMVDMCSVEPGELLNFIPWPTGEEGELYVAVDWSVYDALRRTTVMTLHTEGYARRDIPTQEGLTVLFHQAFSMATHNLGADPDFYNLIVKGIKPPVEKTPFGKDEQRWQSRPRVFNPQEEVSIDPLPPSTKPYGKDLEDKASATVLIQKFGHASGFFITKQGHILTNSHAVGDAQRIRVVTAGKKEKLIAEVLRVDRARDVALLKLESIPPDLVIRPLPIRLEWPAVGEDIYAIGAPLDDRQLQDTVTKGIVSAHRKEMKFMGTRQNFIQGDVTAHPGNSGGPLLDGNGNVVGLCVGTYEDNTQLNYFIPIAEALDRLGITVAQ